MRNFSAVLSVTTALASILSAHTVWAQVSASTPPGGSGQAGPQTTDGPEPPATQGPSTSAGVQASTSGPAGEQPREVVVTGSRISRSDLTAEQPVSVVSGQYIRDRGFTNLADAINQLPAAGVAISPTGDQNDFGTGRNYINLFNLGSQRTLTLVDGRRFVGDNPSSLFANEAGNQVDINALPTLFVDRIEEVPATGAAVYGSDAVAGVVNIILKQKYEGVEVSAQTGLSDTGDAPRYTAEIAFGHSFLNDKLNLAIDFQYDRTNALTRADRPRTAAGYAFAPNPADTGPNDGIPGSILISDTRFSGVTTGGLPFTLNGDPILLPGTNTPAQFGAGGALTPFDQGTLYGNFFGGRASGGDSFSTVPYTALQSPVDRKVVTSIASYEFSPHLRAHATFFASENLATEPVNQPNYSAIAFGASPPGQPIAGLALDLTADNAFLTPQARSVLAANGVSEFLLSRANVDLSPDPVRSSTRTVDGSLSFEGDFDILRHNFTWSAAYVRGASYSEFDQDNIVFGNPDVGVADRFGLALDSVIGPNGQPICRSTLQNPGSTNPDISGCVPLNPFGQGSPSTQSLRYVTANFGNKASNVQDDGQINVSTSLYRLPAGDLKVSLGYEYRREAARFTPSLASQQGIGYSIPLSPQSGGYHTNEYYGEVLAPLFGPKFNVPGIYKLEFDGAYRKVQNSIAGKNEAWSFGGRYSPIQDLTLRGSRSKTFRAPAITELFASGTSAFDFGADPCEADNITSGPNPAVRQQNCAAAFAALGGRANLATFTDSIVGNQTIPVTAQGNDQLKNEIGESYTYGLVVQPRFIPGLAITADYVHIDISNAIEFFGIGNLLESCYDTPGYPSSACGQFTRDATGQVAQANETYINAGFIHFVGVNYTLTYDRNVNQLPLIHTTQDFGHFGFSFNALNTRRNITSASGLGFDAINSAGTIGSSRWRWQSDIRYSCGPVSIDWNTQFVDNALYDLTFTRENQDILEVGDYYRHDLSIQYRITKSLTARFNVNNITDQQAPYPAIGINTYDQVGRYFLLGLSGRF